MAEGKRRIRHRIADLVPSERPRERLAQGGADALSAAELIAILLRTGVEGMNARELAEGLLVEAGGLRGLERMSYDVLRAKRGVGPAKAAQILAAFALGRKLAQEERAQPASITSPEQAAELLLAEMSPLEQESLRALLLDTRNRLIRLVEVYRGSLNSSLVRVGEVFREAVRANAAALIIAHNHPSGDPTPSPEDVAVTRAFVEAGRLLDIEVLDHLIIAGRRHVSLKSRGLGFD
ncbi:MAG: DNA repair protein RadC [Chloroflexota bacterium]